MLRRSSANPISTCRIRPQDAQWTRGTSKITTTALLPMGRVRNVLSVRPRGCTADEAQAEQHNGFFPWSMAKWMVPPTKAVRMSECGCIHKSRTHGTTGWWTRGVSNLKRRTEMRKLLRDRDPAAAKDRRDVGTSVDKPAQAVLQARRGFPEDDELERFRQRERLARGEGD